MITLRPTMCDDCYFRPKYDRQRLEQPAAWAMALEKCRDLASPNQLCHHEDGFFCTGMAAWQKKNLGRMSDVVEAAS